MRETSGRMPLPLTVKLMIVLGAVFVWQCLDDVYFKSRWQSDWLALTADCFTKGHVWQLFTFQFLHGGIFHLAFNLIGLWYFGRFVENVLGPSRFIVTYLGCGLIGGLLQGVLMAVFGLHFGAWVVGASAGVAGLFAIFAMLESQSEVRMYFVLPVKAKVLLWIYAGISLFFTLVPSPRGGGAAHAAHLGGILAGVWFVRMGWHRDFVTPPWEAAFAKVRGMFAPRNSAPVVRPVRFTPSKPPVSAPKPPVVSEADYMSQEVDPILDKISAHGIQSLTERERKILEAARSRMAKR